MTTQELKISALHNKRDINSIHIDNTIKLTWITELAITILLTSDLDIIKTSRRKKCIPKTTFEINVRDTKC